MELRQRFAEQRGSILERWFEAVVATYPVDSREFLGRQEDRFANPVGTTTRRALAGLLDGLLDPQASQRREEAVNGCLDLDPPAAATGPLEELLRIRAVQDFSPSQAVGFVLDLKRILREVLGEAGSRDVTPDGWAQWDGRIDRLALAAFDTFVGFRERVYGLRATEWKNRMFRLLQRANLVCGVDAPDEDPGRERDPGDDIVADGRTRGGS